MSRPIDPLVARARQDSEAEQARARRLGRLTADERLAGLFDDGAHVELLAGARSNAPWSGLPVERPDGDGMRCATGHVGGRTVMAIAHDPSVLRGSIGERGAQKACWAIDRAIELGAPIAFLTDSYGARVQEGLRGIAANADLLDRIAWASGRVPLLSANFGLAGGAAGYAAALTDLIVAVRGRSFAFITGPAVIRAVTGEETSLERIGGTAVHETESGLLHAVVEDDREALAWLRAALAYLPSSAWTLPPSVGSRPPETSLGPDLIPSEPRRTYDVRGVVRALFDGGSVLEMAAPYARNLVTAFARLDGQSVGVVASQPAHLGGVLDSEASIKGARFVRMCQAFNLPIVTLVDSPGFLPGVQQERRGLLRHGAKLVFAYSEARRSVPRVALVLRKSCGASSVLSYGADVVLGLPGAQVQGMGVDGLMALAYGAAATDLDDATRARLREEMSEVHEDPQTALHEGYLHRMVALPEARDALVQALAMSPPPRLADRGGRKLANIPM